MQGIAPLFRVNGEIRCIEGASLDEETLNRLFIEMSSERQRKIFADEMQLSVSRNWPSLGRFRTSVYMHGGCPEMAIRLCETVVRSAEELSLPEVVRDFSRLPNGLILVTGATGTGKTTTLNYMIDQINRERRCKIITIEDPVEFVHENLRSVIVQLEVSTDTPSFRKALVHVLRQDPDVIAVGEVATWKRSKPRLPPPKPAISFSPRSTRPMPCKPFSGFPVSFRPSSKTPSVSNCRAACKPCFANGSCRVLMESAACWPPKFASPLRRFASTSANKKSTISFPKSNRGANSKCERWTPRYWNSTNGRKSHTISA